MRRISFAAIPRTLRNHSGSLRIGGRLRFPPRLFFQHSSLSSSSALVSAPCHVHSASAKPSPQTHFCRTAQLLVALPETVLRVDLGASGQQALAELRAL